MMIAPSPTTVIFRSVQRDLQVQQLRFAESLVKGVKQGLWILVRHLPLSPGQRKPFRAEVVRDSVVTTEMQDKYLEDWPITLFTYLYVGLLRVCFNDVTLQLRDCSLAERHLPFAAMAQRVQ